MELSTSLGAAEFRLSTNRVGFLPPLEGRPFTLLDDGTEVRLLDTGAARYLLIDHRRDLEAPVHVEFWECSRAPEMGLAGLWAVCEAKPVAAR